VLQQVGKRFGVRNVVYRYDIEIIVIYRDAKYVAANTTESIDAYLDCHLCSCWELLTGL
jgi:hypothetical protein